jgi:hypothetical protein
MDFHATLYISDYLSFHEWWTGRNWKEAVLSKTRNYWGLSFVLIKKFIQNSSGEQATRPSFEQGSPAYKVRALPLHQPDWYWIYAWL